MVWLGNLYVTENTQEPPLEMLSLESEMQAATSAFVFSCGLKYDLW